ncbi:MAG: hypothetical protein ACO1OB_34845 [Archangium sp.]
MQRLNEVLPDIQGAAQLVSAEGGWRTVSSQGEVNVDWALSVLRAGEARLYEDFETDTDEVEAVLTTAEATHVVVADGRGAVVLRMHRDANLGMALGYAHAVVRSGVV